jgi:putative membrane protein
LDPADAGPADDGALALYAWTWIGETFAHAAIWRRPVVALVGGAAMGVFAVPALLLRRGTRP